MTRITRKEWRVIRQALDMVAAGPWDDSCFGERPDFEAILDKVADRLPAEPSEAEAPTPPAAKASAITDDDIARAIEAVRKRKAQQS